MLIFLTTDRLVLRRFTASDADAELLIALDADPGVMRYLADGRPTPPAVIRNETLPRILACYERYAGLGYWAAEEKATGEFLGWFLLRPPECTGQPPGPGDVLELGYRLRRAAWGKGYATEGARALVHRAFTDPALTAVRRIVATTMAVNLGSRRVMEKAGLRYVRTFHEEWPEYVEGAEHGDVEYELRRADRHGTDPVARSSP